MGLIWLCLSQIPGHPQLHQIPLIHCLSTFVPLHPVKNKRDCICCYSFLDKSKNNIIQFASHYKIRYVYIMCVYNPPSHSLGGVGGPIL